MAINASYANSCFTIVLSFFQRPVPKSRPTRRPGNQPILGGLSLSGCIGRGMPCCDFCLTALFIVALCCAFERVLASLRAVVLIGHEQPRPCHRHQTSIAGVVTSDDADDLRGKCRWRTLAGLLWVYWLVGAVIVATVPVKSCVARLTCWPISPP